MLSGETNEGIASSGNGRIVEMIASNQEQSDTSGTQDLKPETRKSHLQLTYVLSFWNLHRRLISL